MIKDRGVLDLGESIEEYREVIRGIFQSGRASDTEIQADIDRYVKEHSYILCPHSAAGTHTLRLVQEKGQSYICCATAHPGKFFDVTKYAGMRPALPRQLEGLLEQEKR